MSGNETSIQFAEREDKTAVENNPAFAPKFDAAGLIPAITTDAETGEVLMLAYMNAESIARTLETGDAVYWSRSRKCLWHKGDTSGHTLEVVEMRVDCDQDSLWLRVTPRGPGCCHTGHRSCFYRRLPSKGEFAEYTGDQPLPLVQTEADRAFDPSQVYRK